MQYSKTFVVSTSQDNAKHLLGEASHGVVVTDQCASYNWLDPTRHQFCLAHVQRNLQEMAEYSGGGQTAYLVVGSCCYSRACSAPSIVTRLEQLVEPLWFRQCSDYDEVSECS